MCAMRIRVPLSSLIATSVWIMGNKRTENRCEGRPAATAGIGAKNHGGRDREAAALAVVCRRSSGNETERSDGDGRSHRTGKNRCDAPQRSRSPHRPRRRRRRRGARPMSRCECARACGSCVRVVVCPCLVGACVRCVRVPPAEQARSVENRSQHTICSARMGGCAAGTRLRRAF